MKNPITAFDILEKIRKIEDDFVFNQDENLTNKLKVKIDETDWQKIKEHNRNELKRTNIEYISNQHTVNLSTDTSWSDYNLNKLNENKIITQCCPDNTRFKMFKKIMNKLMMVSLRYQEIFNTAAVSLFSQMIKKINSLNSQVAIFNNDVSETKRILENIRNNIEDLNSLDFNCLNTKLQQQEAWLKNISDKVENNEKWLNQTNMRIDGQEKWLNTTNKRIDTCNEMLSASPDIGYQSFSQAGEDIIIMHILSKIEQGINRVSYLDIGCNHYKNYNNTYRLYQKGYSGILVEANPMLISELSKYRPRDKVLNYGIGTDSKEVLDFYIINGGGLSSFNKKTIDDVLSNDPDAYIEKIEKVRIITFNEIVENYVDEIPTVVSIDIEGDEYSVLKSIDYSRFRPLVFIVETIEYRKHLTIGTKRNNIIELMKVNGYLEFAFTGINSIFIDASKVAVEQEE